MPNNAQLFTLDEDCQNIISNIKKSEKSKFVREAIKEKYIKSHVKPKPVKGEIVKIIG